MRLKEESFSIKIDNSTVDESSELNETEKIKSEEMKHLEFIVEQYRNQGDSVAVRIGKRKSDMLASISLFVVVFLLDMVLTLLIRMPRRNSGVCMGNMGCVHSPFCCCV